MENKQTFEDFFRYKNPNYDFLLSRMRCALDIKEVTYADINTLNMIKFKRYMTDEVRNSSLKVYMAVIAATVNMLTADGLCQHIDFKPINRLKCEKSEHIALTEDEVELFMSYYDRIKDQPTLERDILTIFLLEVCTGARNSDCKMFSRESILDGYLTYVSKKTKTLTRVPAHRMLPQLLDRIPKKDYSRTTTCRKIKEIAKKLGIDRPEKRMYRGVLKTRPRYEYIASHTARRSFISILLDKGVPLATVSKMAGHSDVKMTLRYYKSDQLVLDDAAMSFFNS